MISSCFPHHALSPACIAIISHAYTSDTHLDALMGAGLNTGGTSQKTVRTDAVIHICVINTIWCFWGQLSTAMCLHDKPKPAGTPHGQLSLLAVYSDMIVSVKLLFVYFQRV
jgi:hypothetical protein